MRQKHDWALLASTFHRPAFSLDEPSTLNNRLLHDTLLRFCCLSEQQLLVCLIGHVFIAVMIQLFLGLQFFQALHSKVVQLLLHHSVRRGRSYRLNRQG